jgi:hypothetical protein
MRRALGFWKLLVPVIAFQRRVFWLFPESATRSQVMPR